MSEVLPPDQPPAQFVELQEKGWQAEFVTDAAGKIYEPHVHEETRLYTVAGSMQIRVRDRDEDEWSDWVEQKAGDAFVVKEGQYHEAQVGDDGWSYWAAWDPEAAKNWPHNQ